MNKAVFVKNFSDFMIQNVPAFDGVKSLVYVNDGNNEWVYINFNTYSQKRINVNYDSEVAIIKDVLKNYEDAPWIVPIDEDIFNK